MIDGFKKNYWYRFNKRAESAYIVSGGIIYLYSNEKFMMDGKWHQCKERGIFHHMGYFYDSSEPSHCCYFGDERKPAEERLYMFDELSPAMYNIKKLKENQLDKD